MFFYKDRFIPEMPKMTKGDCMEVGALAGVVGAFVSFLLSGIFISLFGNLVREFIVHRLESSNLPFPPNTLDEIERSIRQSETAWSFWGLFFSLIIYPLFGMLGGLLGWLFFKPKEIVYVQQIIQQPIPPQTNSPSESEQPKV